MNSTLIQFVVLMLLLIFGAILMLEIDDDGNKD